MSSSKAAGSGTTVAYRFSPTRPELPRQLFHQWVRRREVRDLKRCGKACSAISNKKSLHPHAQGRRLEKLRGTTLI